MVEFTYNEYNELDKYLQVCGWNREGCKVRWESNISFGVYRPMPESIGISISCAGMIKEITPCVIHELTHRKQRYRVGLIPYYALLAVMRWRWEKEAINNEDESMKKLGLKF